MTHETQTQRTHFRTRVRQPRTRLLRSVWTPALLSTMCLGQTAAAEPTSVHRITTSHQRNDASLQRMRTAPAALQRRGVGDGLDAAARSAASVQPWHGTAQLEPAEETLLGLPEQGGF